MSRVLLQILSAQYFLQLFTHSRVMRKSMNIIIIVLSLGLVFPGHSQTMFYEVVSLDSTYDVSLLKENALSVLEELIGVKKTKKSKELDPRIAEIESGYKTTNSFFVYKFKHPEFKISYTINIEAKEGRFRYILEDFKAEKYERNRYGRYVPSRNGHPQLSDENFPADQKTWDKTLLMVPRHVESVTKIIKLKMSEKPVLTEQILTLNEDW